MSTQNEPTQKTDIYSFHIALDHNHQFICLDEDGIMLDDPSDDSSYYLTIPQLIDLMKTHATCIADKGHYIGR